MSCKSKNQSAENHLYCDVCKINISTEAEYALHQFSKKHCDNLLRIAKNKPVVTKQKSVKQEMPSINKEQPKVNVITTQGSFAKYGYFVPGEVYDTNLESREFNTEYDPYLQKYAENPLKEYTKPGPVQPTELPSPPTLNITSFKRKKKKKIRTCQICNVTLLTVPEYEAHMRSPQHSWKLKMSGMGVSAHFVKASSDLHTVEANEDSTESEELEETSIDTGNTGTSNSSVLFPTLYCDICELLLNSEQQYNAHVNGKSHNDNVQRKAEIKARKQQLESVSLNQLYCFSCKVALNNLQQYNEHKFGKKHKLKCRRLMREGITIPPEERVASWGVLRTDPKKPVVYPEMYEKFLKETEQKGTLSDSNERKIDSKNSGDNYCSVLTCSVSYSDGSPYQLHVNSEEHQRLICDESKKLSTSLSGRGLLFHDGNNASQGSEPREQIGLVTSVEETHGEKHTSDLNIISFSETLKCSICSLNFVDEPTFGMHISTEDHARKIVDLKEKGTKDDEILEKLIKDRSVAKLDNFGRYSCSMCSVTTASVLEYRQHVASVVHKQTEEEYQKKVMCEVKSAVGPDEKGKFACNHCREDYASLIEYNQHLHTAKHREGLKTEKARKLKAKNRLLLQHKRVKQKYIISGLKRKDFACWRRNCEKNPSARTKISETDSSMDCKETVSNVAQSVSKTSPANEESGVKRGSEEEKRNSNKRVRHNNWNRDVSGPCRTVKPLMAVNNTIPFLAPPPPLMSTTAWRPCYPPHFRPNFFPNLPNNPWGRYLGNRYQRGPIFRPSRPRHPPCYN